MSITRLAPSPTGALHLGNARTFIVNWLLARQRNWRVLLRIEDLDGPRIKSGADRLAIEDLQWLGIDWDETPKYQSDRRNKYDAAVKLLLETHQAYACICSRREVENAASAPHADDGSSVYPQTCRGRFKSLEDARATSGKAPVVRFAARSGVVEFGDAFAGIMRFDVSRQLGDFVIAKADGTAAYQLAVVIDDADMGVTQVVRGDDLLDSTPRQMQLYQALHLAEKTPRYWHLPLVVGPDGRRLAKRHGDTRLSYYRDLGVPASRVLSLLGRWCGVQSIGPEAQTSELLDAFQIERMPKERIVFTADDDQWLRRGA